MGAASGGEGFRIFGNIPKEAAPLVVTVFFGANDAALPDRSSASQHVPLHEYKINLHEIISFIKTRFPTSHILLITPPSVDEEGRIEHPYGENPDGLPKRTNQVTGTYATVCISVAVESRLPVVDIWTEMQQFPGWQKACLSDGLHPTAIGSRIIFEMVVVALKKDGVSPGSLLPFDIPPFTDFENQTPTKPAKN